MACSLTLACLDCGLRFEASPLTAICPNCEEEWLEAEFEDQRAGPTLLSLARERPFDMWRYLEVLPVCEGRPNHSMG